MVDQSPRDTDATSCAAVVIRFYEDGVNRRNWKVVADLLAPNFTHNGGELGPDGQRRSLEALYAAFPDAQVTVADVVAEGDKVATRMIWRGTHRGPFMGVPASGHAATWAATSVIRIADGRIADAWVTEDDLGLLRQLGATLRPGTTTG